MTRSAITMASALLALVVSGFVPAPAAISVMSGTAQAAQPTAAPKPKPKTRKTRKKKKKKANASQRASQSAKKGARAAEGKTSKPKVATKGKKRSGKKGRKTRKGKRASGTFTTLAQVAVIGSELGLSDSAATGGARSRSRAARMKPKAVASPATRAKTAALKQQRANAGQTAKSALQPAAASPPAGAVRPISDTSSVITRQVGPGTATQMAEPKTKRGQKSRFYFNPLRWITGKR